MFLLLLIASTEKCKSLNSPLPPPPLPPSYSVIGQFVALAPPTLYTWAGLVDLLPVTIFNHTFLFSLFVGLLCKYIAGDAWHP